MQNLEISTESCLPPEDKIYLRRSAEAPIEAVK